MELDEMKLAWQALDQRLAQQQALHLQQFRDSRMDRMRHRLRPLAWGQAIQIAFGVALMLWGISFWSARMGDAHSMACGIAMQVFGTLSVIFPARLLSLVQSIDYAEPVLEIQRRIAGIRAWRVRVEAPVFAVLGSLIWIPAMLMLMQYSAEQVEINLWRQFPGLALWMLLCGGVSLAVVGLAYALLRRLGLRGWLENNFVGKAVQRAEAELEVITRFERESG